MKPFVKTLLISTAALFALSGVAFAAAERTTSQLNSDQTYTGLYARAADTVTVKGEVSGDVWVAGSTVEVDGIVHGNVYAAGSTVRVKGQVDGSVHAAGSIVEVGGMIKGSVYVAGSEVTLGDDSKIAGAAALAGSKVRAGGDIAQQLYIGGSTIDLSSRVGQFAHLAASDISLSDRATIAGDLTYQSPDEARIANDRGIGGTVKHDATKKVESNPVRDRLTGAGIGLVFNLVIGLFFVLWLSRLLNATDRQFVSNPAAVLLRGVAFMVLTPIVLLFVAITIIGIPLASVGALIYVALLIAAPAIVSYSLGRLIVQAVLKSPETTATRFQAILVGSVAFTLVSLIPLVGGIIEFLLCSLGLGMVVARGFRPLQSSSPSNHVKKA